MRKTVTAEADASHVRHQFVKMPRRDSKKRLFYADKLAMTG